MVAVTALLVAVGLVTAVAPAEAATPVAGAAVRPSVSPGAVPASGGLTLRSMSPGVVTRETDLTITGVLAAGGAVMVAPRVSLVRGGPLLSTRQDVTDWSTASTPAAGVRLVSATPTPTLAAGASIPFTLTVPAGTVRDSSPYGVLPVALEVTSDQGTTSVHTFVGWFARKEYEQLDVAVVAPVTLPADTALYADDATVRARAWQRDLGSGSRLDRVLRGTDAPGAPVTWAVDPAVLGPGPTAPSGGSTGTGSPPASPTSSPTSSPPGPGAPTGPAGAAGSQTPGATLTDPVTSAQQQLAARLGDGATRHPVWALPYADPDLAATLVSPSDPLVSDEIRRASALSGQLGDAQVSTGIAWAVDGSLPADRESGLRTAYGGGLRGALVSSSTLPGTSGFSATAPHLSPGGLPVVGWDDVLSGLTTRTRTVSDGVLATQELVAQTATLLGQSPGIPRSFLIAVPRTIDPSPEALRSMLTALAAVPWVRIGSAERLVSAAATSGDPLTSVGASTWQVARPGLTPALRRSVDGARTAVEAVTTLLPRRSGELGLWQDSLDQVVSSRWRGQPAGPASLVGAATRWARTATTGIRVLSQDTNFLADEGILQVTVVNDLDEPVAGLVLSLSPSNPRLRVLEQPAAFPIAARSRATVRVRVRAVAAGLVPVTVSLRSRDGLPVGTSAQLNIRANPPGSTFYLVSGAVLVLLLVVGVLRSVRRRRRPVPSP